MTSDKTSSPSNARGHRANNQREPDGPEFASWEPDRPETALGPTVPPCPDGNDQRLVEILGFRLKVADYLQLRVLTRDGDRGICHVTLEQDPGQVRVLAVACLHEADHESWRRTPSTRMDSPCNLWLDEPLDERTVVDIDSGLPLPLCIPGWDRDAPTVYVPRPPGVLWPKQRHDTPLS
jgi:hypothetical protein